MLKTVIAVLGSALGIYLIAGLYLYLNQRSYIYFPIKRETIGDPHASVTLETTAGRTHALTVNPGRDHALVYFGGNAEDVSVNKAFFDELFPDHSAYLLDYRGYGYSDGSPTEAALYHDAVALYDLLDDRHATVGVIGRSLGSGPATHLAIAREVDRLVLVTPYDSITRLAQLLYPAFPVSLLLKDRFDSASRAHAIDCPTLVVIAPHDKIIPPERAHALVDAFRAIEPQVAVIEGAGHNDLLDNEHYRRSLAGFIRPGRLPEP